MMDCVEFFSRYLEDGIRIGLAGVGVLGTALRQAAAERGCHVMLCDPPRNMEEADELGDRFFELWGNGMGGCQLSNAGMETFVPLSALKCCRVVSIQVPFKEKGEWPTAGMIDRNFMDALGADAIVLCFSPEGVIAQDVRRDSRIVYFS